MAAKKSPYFLKKSFVTFSLGLLFTFQNSCATRNLNPEAPSDTESLADKTHILGVIKNDDNSTYSFQLCKKNAGGSAIQATCVNPFVDAEGQPGRFVTVPNSKSHFALVGQGKAVAVVVGGTLVIAASAFTLGAAAGVAAGATASGFGGLAAGLAAFPMGAAVGGVAGGAGLWVSTRNKALWGREERELAKNYEDLYKKDGLSSPAPVSDVQKLLPAVGQVLGFKLRS